MKKYFKIKILMTDFKHRGEHKKEQAVPYVAIAWCISTAKVSGGRDSKLGSGPGCLQCSPKNVSKRTVCISLTFLTFQTLAL